MGRARTKAIGLTFGVFMGFIFGFSAEKALAHGENAPGPNGGEIRMPGAFHTEVVSDDSGLKIYLLDIQFKNPITENSSVSVTAFEKGKKSETKCLPQGSAFLCPLPALKKTKGLEFEVNAIRAGVAGNKVTYSWPLRFAKKAPGAAEQMQNNQDHQHDHHH